MCRPQELSRSKIQTRSLQRLHHPPDPPIRVRHHRLEVSTIGHLGHDFRAGDRDAAAVVCLLYDHVAWEKQPDLWVDPEGAVREVGVACAEDDVGTELHVDLLFKRLPDIDLRQYPESLCLERLGD